MVTQHPLTVHVPIKGKVLIRLDGTEVLHEVGEFSQDVSVAFAPGPGEVSFQFDPKFWEGAVKDRGVGAPTPLEAPMLDATAILQLLEDHVQSARNNRCTCGWRPMNESIIDNAGAQHRRHLASLIAFAGVVADV